MNGPSFCRPSHAGWELTGSRIPLYWEDREHFLKMSDKGREDAVVGTLLGTALGDALGLPCEGMSRKVIARRFGQVDRFFLLWGKGFVSDDTEQSALVAQSILTGSDLETCVRHFRRGLLGWFLRLPWGIGLGTLRACFKIALGVRESGVPSAGNGAAMRAAIVGAAFSKERDKRLSYGRALAGVTHTDPRAVDGALFVAELAALSVESERHADRSKMVADAMRVVQDPSLKQALSEAASLAEGGSSLEEALPALDTSGFVIHSVPFAVFCFIRFGDDFLRALSQAISAGGDTDTNAAILGGWLGAYHGAHAIPRHLVQGIHDGPFGPTHLRALALALSRGEKTAPPYSAIRALLRNLLLYPVVLAHGLRRLLPF